VENFYEISTNSVPIKWTAPEVFKFHKHSIKSDVWAYGITIWELMEDGAIPYPEFDNDSCRQNVLKGYRLPKPKKCPDALYAIMQDTWKENPNDRPSFKEINKKLEEMVQKGAVSNVVLEVAAQTSDIYN